MVHTVVVVAVLADTELRWLEKCQVAVILLNQK
jgi:hypothetical protein